ncbi:MAG: efflux RND transporter permease subunit [Planctomycetota bacterium]
MSLAAFGVRKPVVANLVMFAIIGAGLVFGVGLTREFFPQTDPNFVIVTAPYPGASPEEVETALARKIEDAVYDLDGVKELTTTASEGAASVRIEYEDGFDIDAAVADVKREVDALQDLPEDADRIVVDKLEPNLPVIVLSLMAGDDAEEREMKQAIRSIRNDLESLDGMGDVVLSGARRDEIVVEVRPEAVLEHRLSLPDISNRIRAEMRELPGGSVRTNLSNISVRVLATDEQADRVRDIVVKGGADGQVIRLGDIAEVSEGFADVDVRQRFNGRDAMSVTIYKIGDEDAVSMAELVKAYVAGRNGEGFAPTRVERLRGLLRPPNDTGPLSDREAAHRLGASRQATPLPGEILLSTDLARFIVGRLELLTRNALAGGMLVFLTLLVLLNWRVSFWVAVGLGISLLGTLGVMYFTGTTLNLLTMFGLIIVLGILVDDAIVVAENITARYEQGEDSITASIKGADQVTWPVVATVLTTICAFFPLTLIGGNVGDFLGVLPIVVVCALSVSLIECLFILPAHMRHSLKANRDRDAAGGGLMGAFGKFEAKFDKARDAFFDKALIPTYLKGLKIALRYRYLSLLTCVTVVAISLAAVASSVVPFSFLGSADSETINVELEMPVGTSAAVTDTYIRRLERAILAQPEVDSVFSQVGAIGSLEGEGESTAPHIGQLIMELKAVEERDKPADLVINDIRVRLGELSGIKSLQFIETQGGPSGADISFAVAGIEPENISAVADEIKALLATYKGVRDITDDADAGARELTFKLRPGANELGFTTENVAQQIRGAVLGLEAYTFAGDREDIDVRVIMPERVRRSLSAVEDLYLISPMGEAVPAMEVVEITEAEGYATVRRLDGRRTITVTADVDITVNTEQVAAAVGPRVRELASKYPDIIILERGRQKELADSFSTLPLGMMVAIGLIYVILTWLFQSYLQPLIVLMAVPFAIIGTVWGHFILQFDLTILSLIGFIALAGIVVNDSLIFMDFFNQARARGWGVYDACVITGRARFRAILLTTITTVLGLLPLMLEQSFQARFLIPMAITISGGLISATVIVLGVLPCLLLVLDDIKRLVLGETYSPIAPTAQAVQA